MFSVWNTDCTLIVKIMTYIYNILYIEYYEFYAEKHSYDIFPNKNSIPSMYHFLYQLRKMNPCYNYDFRVLVTCSLIIDIIKENVDLISLSSNYVVTVGYGSYYRKMNHNRVDSFYHVDVDYIDPM